MSFPGEVETVPQAKFPELAVAGAGASSEAGAGSAGAAGVVPGMRVEEGTRMSVVFPLQGGEDEMSWQERALCAQTDPESFFPEKGGSTREAKKVCTGCDVKGDCLEYALAHDERFGIWGGLSERERRRLKKQAV
jgi:WhiB family transcriptional regulator, redox-sensing transcriptional regulator